MFSGFKRALPQISIFHHPSSPPSNKALALLRASLSSPYPPTNPSSKPLQFDLEVVESTPPTADQLTTILSYLPTGSSSAAVFLSSHPAAPAGDEKPNNVAAVVKLANQNPNVLKWPVVVDWTGGRASIGDVEGVKGILEEVRRLRDGENKSDEEHKPKGWFS
jgi:arsenate reductase-like glutaredoxin family protein